MDRPWTSGIVKRPVRGVRWIGTTNIEGDGQADLRHHGGPDKAVLGYGAAHYASWRAELPDADLGPGAFGENLTIGGLDERVVAIGDVWRAGTALLQVSQPRQPCWKLARRFRISDMVERVHGSGRTGWYLRVIEEGEVAPGARMELLDRPYPYWTVARATEVLRDPASAPAVLLDLAGIDALSSSWVRTAKIRAAGGVVDASERIRGPER